MTTARESEILTRVGPGTPMGNMLRHYWLPAAKSSELAADGEPMRLKLLGEELIAFRDSTGRIGVMDHRCPHRCASLFFGRNEEGGIRCVYHGWKFDVDGKCLDMANVPPHQDFKHKVHAKAYRAAERNGLVWVYMGERQDAPPPLPLIESTLEAEADLEIDFIQRDCNWLQALEGDIDTSHLGFLHLGAAQSQTYANGNIDLNVVANRSPEFIVEDTPFGTTYGAHRPSEDGGTYWRFAHFMFPCWTLPPISVFEANVVARAWVPLDDHHTMFILVANKNARKRRPSQSFADGKEPAGTATKDKYLPRTTDWLGRWKLVANAANDYLIDRDVQRTESYTGIDGIHLQDQAITESMGPITNHAGEHLAPSDIPIARTRRRILAAAVALAEKGAVPPGVDTPEDYRLQRGGSFVAAAELDWREAYAQRVAQDVVPRATKAAAE